MKCLLCDKNIENDELVSSFQIHIRYSHGVTDNQEFVLSLYVLDQDEIRELTNRIADRLNSFKLAGSAAKNQGTKLFSDIDNKVAARGGQSTRVTAG